MASYIFRHQTIGYAIGDSSSSNIIGNSEYIGCYIDKREMHSRALPHGYLVDKQMTPLICINTCTAHGLPFAGLQWGNECWCGQKKPRWGKTTADSACYVPCGGNTWWQKNTCGGSLTLSVWQNRDYHENNDNNNPTQVPLPVDPSLQISLQRGTPNYRPLLALVMMLKNEAHTIRNTLQVVRAYIDVWYILDTGSTDGTQALVREIMGNIPGELWEEPFIDWGTTRNRVLDIANNSHPRPVFTLMLSADETMINAADLRDFLKEQVYSFGHAHGAYPVVMDSGQVFDSLRVARSDGNWRYEGRAHEYLRAPDAQFHETFRPPIDIKVRFAATDGERRYKSQFKIAEILRDEINHRPNHTRSLFYLARTYTHLQNLTGAMWAYERLALVSKWKDERYEAMYHRAIVAREMGADWNMIHQLFLEAYNSDPSKADALYEIAIHYMIDESTYPIAWIYTQLGVHLPLPDTARAIQNVLLRDIAPIHNHRFARVAAQLSRHSSIQDWVTCVQACNHLLLQSPRDKDLTEWKNECLTHLPSSTERLPSLHTKHSTKAKNAPIPGVITVYGDGSSSNSYTRHALLMMVITTPVLLFVFIWCVRRRPIANKLH